MTTARAWLGNLMGGSSRLDLAGILLFMSEQPRPVPGDIYEHYKKKNYRVFSMGLDASRQEDIVIYQALYPTAYAYFSRPLTEWNELVSTSEGFVPRFRRIEGQTP